MTRAALMDVSYFFGLGNYFATREQEEKAAGFYEKAIQQTVDEVRIANRCGWLVEYYFRKERLAEADKLADRAAETYSMTGLETKGDLLFLQGKYPESFDMFQYQYLRDRLKTADMLFIFWDGKEYREGKARLPNHRFGVAFATYSRRSP